MTDIPDIRITVKDDETPVVLSVQENEDSVHIKVTDNSGDLPPVYDGETVITPNESQQTLETANKILQKKIVVEPIPSNYGRISYNGAFLTVE